MGCQQLTYQKNNFLQVVHRKNGQVQKKNTLDYFSGGMAMPNRNIVGDYRYDFQGQELDPETGKIAFELRLYDPRINRWLTTDPKNEFSSPYLAMGNNWVNRIDPDGGSTAPPDRYKLGADGSVTYYDDKGGDLVDYLFVEGDLGNEIRVTDTSILPQLEGNSIFQKSYHSPSKFLEGSYAISGNHNQVKRLYDWIGARNSNEWTYVKASTDFGNKSFIGTLRTNDQGLNPSSGRGGFGNFSIIEHSHTHFGTALYDFQPSGSDVGFANRIRETNPNAKFSIYSPLITKGLYNQAIKGKHRAPGIPYKAINYEPTKYIPY